MHLLGGGSPSSATDFLDGWLLTKFGANKLVALFIFAGFMWATWRKRNKMTIEKTFPESPSEVLLYEFLFCRSGSLLKEGDRAKLDQARRKVLNSLHNLRPADTPATDVFEL